MGLGYRFYYDWSLVLYCGGDCGCGSSYVAQFGMGV